MINDKNLDGCGGSIWNLDGRGGSTWNLGGCRGSTWNLDGCMSSIRNFPAGITEKQRKLHSLRQFPWPRFDSKPPEGKSGDLPITRTF